VFIPSAPGAIIGFAATDTVTGKTTGNYLSSTVYYTTFESIQIPGYY